MDDWWYEGMLRLLGGRVEAADALGAATGELRVELESVGYLEPG